MGVTGLGRAGGVAPSGDEGPGAAAATTSGAAAAPEATVARGGAGGGRMAVWTGMSEPKPLPEHMWAGIAFRNQTSPVLGPDAREAVKKAEYFLHTGLFDREVSREDATRVLDLLDGLDPREWASAVDTLASMLQDGSMLLTKLFEQGFAKHPDLMDRFVAQCVAKLPRTFQQPRLPDMRGDITPDMYRTFLTEHATGEAIRRTVDAWTPSVKELVGELPEALFSPYLVLGIMGLPFEVAHKVSLSVRKAVGSEP